MIQAAPLVLSFARAVPMLNRLVGAVGITELGDRVNNYIQENPDESAKIVSMIMPTQGIANALKNKSSEDVEEVEETEEVTTGSGVEERIREILREAGVEDADNQDLTDLPKDLEAKVMSGIAKSSTDRKKDMIEASAIIGLSGPGRERKKMIDDVSGRYDEGGVEEVTRPKYEGYKKFIRRRRADGGAIGIEVLFEEKKPRQGLFMGGPALEGPALGIYNSMKAYQSFTDQEIANAIKEAGYELPTADSGTTPPGSTPGNNLGYQSGNEGQGGIMNLDPYSKGPASPGNQSNTSSKYSVAEIEKGIDIYGNPIDESITSKGFIGSAMDKFSSLPGIKQGKNLINTIMDNTLVGRIAAMRNPLNPNASNYNPSLQGQIDMLGGMTGTKISGTYIDPYNKQLGFTDNLTGQPMTGRDPNSGLGVYGPGSVLAGQNVVSGFGTNDYEDQLQGYIDKMLDRRTKGILTEFQTAKLKAAEAELERAREKAQDRIDELNRQKIEAKKAGDAKKARDLQIAAAAKAQEISNAAATAQQEAIEKDQDRSRDSGQAGSGTGGIGATSGYGYNQGNECFEPNTFIQMANGSEKKIKDIQLGDDTKGGEVTGVFKFKPSGDGIYSYRDVTVAGSHFVKEDGKFIMVKDSPLAVKIDKIPVVYSLDTTGRRIFINDIEFADYNGDGVAKNFLTNAGVDLTGFDTEVLRQVENRLI